MNPAYKLNQHLVYPLQGVGEITAIETRTFKGKEVLYYIIYLDISDMTIMVPTEKTEELGIRPIVSPEESIKALELLSVEYEPVVADWKMRYQMNLDLLKAGSVEDNATVVRTLYHRSKVKELPIQERKLYDSALKILSDELIYSLQKTKNEVEEMIFSKLEA